MYIIFAMKKKIYTPIFIYIYHHGVHSINNNIYIFLPFDSLCEDETSTGVKTKICDLRSTTIASKRLKTPLNRSRTRWTKKKNAIIDTTNRWKINNLFRTR